MSHASFPGAVQESFQKALRSLETGCDGWSLPRKWKRMDNQQLVYNLRVPNPERVLVIKQVGVSHAWRVYAAVTTNADTPLSSRYSVVITPIVPCRVCIYSSACLHATAWHAVHLWLRASVGYKMACSMT